MNQSLPEILERLSGAKKVGSGWMARCPAHDDLNPSLSISEKQGTVLFFCHAGCSFRAIQRALNLKCLQVNGKSQDGWRVSESNSKTITAQYDYFDEGGSRLYQIVRFEADRHGTKEKSFCLRRQPQSDEIASSDGWIYNKSRVAPVLYNLPRLATAELVYVVEGEKDVDTLSSYGLVATCNPFGAGKWKAEFGESLRGKTVVILPDNDETGRTHAEAVATALHGIAREVLVIDLPNVGEKGDVTDFLMNGATPDDLLDLVQRAEPWPPPSNGESPQTHSKFVFTTLNQLLVEEPEEITFVWEDTLPSAGFAICSAKPKVGKSTFARNLAVAVSTGQPFLGRETVKGKVLYLCLEEKRSEIRGHFERMAVSSHDILVYTGKTPNDAIHELAGAMEEYAPVLIIIDPLSRVIRVTDFNDYGSMVRALEPLLDLARSSGAHILALHHDSKMERTGGDALLGSTALFGTVDCHIQLKKRDKGRTILTTQRYGEDMPESVIELDRNTGILSSAGDLESVTIEAAGAAIMDCIVGGEALEEREIKTRVEGFSRGSISKALRILVKDDSIRRAGQGKRGEPYIYSKRTTDDLGKVGTGIISYISTQKTSISCNTD